uniref:Uncharacterized protein n=1 Tax=OCS116 cluster bacterium TaxID=2030921 RepID=A0A2A4YW15_9PROT
MKKAANIKQNVTANIQYVNKTDNIGPYTNNQEYLTRYLQAKSRISIEQAKIYASFILGGVK